MKIFRLILVGMILGIGLAYGFLWMGAAGAAQAQRNAQPAASTPVLSSEQRKIASQYNSPGGNDETPPPKAVQAPNELPTPIPGETLVYFVTSDSDATATVLYLYNTDSAPHTVALRGYSYSGVLGYSLNIDLPAFGFQRLSSDSIPAAPPPSWATPAPIITNFTDFTYYVSLSLPRGVKVDGYTLFNPGTGTVDPRADQGEIPIRFSTDPLTLFLPAVQKNRKGNQPDPAAPASIDPLLRHETRPTSRRGDPHPFLRPSPMFSHWGGVGGWEIYNI